MTKEQLNKEIFDTNARKAINDLINNQSVLTEKINALTEVINTKSIPAPAPIDSVPAPVPAPVAPVPAPVPAPTPIPPPAPADPPAQ